ncbi:MAG: pre-peptidase C-terminal domain-containing protein, partial [Proteobacteria bacterium]|nr:pre-peptidase C-terminal domain-containing protein [Pseudomonadota bacterium]
VPVTNSGTLTTGVSFQVQLLVDGTEEGTQTIGPLAPSVTESVTFTAGPLAAGTRGLSVVADPIDAVTESDESNNTSMESLAVVAETALVEGTPITNVGAALDVELLFGFQFPVADGLSIEFKLTAGTGTADADMYVHRGERPASRDDYECISGAIDSNESCRFEAALAGTYHVLIHAFTTFSGVTLSVTTVLEVLPFDIEVVFTTDPTSVRGRRRHSAGGRAPNSGPPPACWRRRRRAR